MHRQMLLPENKAYPVIRPTCLRLLARNAQASATHRQEGELEIFGVVVGQFRKYR